MKSKRMKNYKKGMIEYMNERRREKREERKE